MRKKPIWRINRASYEQRSLNLSPRYRFVLEGDTVEEIESAYAEAMSTFKGQFNG